MEIKQLIDAVRDYSIYISDFFEVVCYAMAFVCVLVLSIQSIQGVVTLGSGLGLTISSLMFLLLSYYAANGELP